MRQRKTSGHNEKTQFMELGYWRKSETTGDTRDNARTQSMELCYWRQREKIADKGKS